MLNVVSLHPLDFYREKDKDLFYRWAVFMGTISRDNVHPRLPPYQLVFIKDINTSLPLGECTVRR